MKRKFLVSLLALLMIFSVTGEAIACTGTIIGKGVSESGDPMIARTEDWSSAYNKIFYVREARDWNEGDMYTDVYGFSYPMPAHTYHTITVPDGYQDEGDIFEAAGINEMGVTMTATVTATANDKALTADPLTEHGLYESSVVSVVLPRVKTAREGVEVLADIMDTRGLQEGAIVVVADQDEVWYMELLTGHQYVAVKYPDDAYSVFPNCFMLGTVDVNDKENVIASKNLLELPRQHGFLVEEDGMIHVRKTYAEELTSGNRDRLWGGINFLDKDKNIPYDAEEFELFQKTDKKISLKDVMELQRTRYEGTEKAADLPENKGKVRPIGTVEQEEAHIIQIKQNYPAELGGVLWVALGNAEHAPYIPIYGPINEVNPSYQVMGDQFNADSAYWIIRQNSALAELDREVYGKYYREYNGKLEDKMIAEQAEIDKKLLEAYAKSPESAVDYGTKVSLGYQESILKNARDINAEFNTYFLDASSDQGAVKVNGRTKPFIPSQLGEERRVEILKELGFSAGPGSAQPLDKGEQLSADEELKGHWAKDVLKAAVDKGLIEREDKLSKPNKLVTVGEFVEGLRKLNPEFKGEEVLAKLEQHAIVDNYIMNRQTMAFILEGYAKELKLNLPELKIQAKDIDYAPEWTHEGIRISMNMKWINGHGGNFGPDQLVNRGVQAQVYANLAK